MGIGIISFYPLFLLSHAALGWPRLSDRRAIVGSLFTPQIVLNPIYASLHPRRAHTKTWAAAAAHRG